jgi:hypothetical protein
MKGEGTLACLQSLGLFGCLLFVPAIFMLLLAMQRGCVEDNWNTPTIIGLFVDGGAMLALFIAWENWKGDGAMIPGSVVGRRTAICTILLAFCHIGSLTVTAYYLPEWFQAVQGVGPLQSGVRMLATVIPQLVATIASSSLGKYLSYNKKLCQKLMNSPAWRLKYYNPWFFIGPVLMCIATSLYTQFTAFSTPLSHWIGFQFIQGIGAGFVMQI